ncbi:MAG TPA: AAA family ATPase [Pyrinomonadaceae bacterium]
MSTDTITDRSELFELELELPDERLQRVARRLIGFEERYERLRRDMHLLSNPEELQAWSKKLYRNVLPVCEVIADRYPLIVFEGDVGTGKTATAESASDRLAREVKKPAMLFKMSTRVRGSGKVGQMSTLINQAFEVVAREAGKTKYSFLIVDEADSLTTTRDNSQSHHEDKVAVNTIIQKVDDVRKFGGRILVFLCTNRVSALDPAVLRRAARIETFQRPDDSEREQLIRMDCEGIGLSDSEIRELVGLTGPSSHPSKIGFTFSDLRSKWLPEALGYAFPNRKLTADDLIKAARAITPSPAIKGGDH